MNDPAARAQFEKRQERIFAALLRAACGSAPFHWRVATLRVEAAPGPTPGSRALRHELLNPETGESVSSFPETLFHATAEYHDLFGAHQQGWKRCIVEIQFDELGRVRQATANFEYASPTG